MAQLIDDRYNKLRRDIGNDFSRDDKVNGDQHNIDSSKNAERVSSSSAHASSSEAGSTLRVKELYSFRCGSCGYRNIHDVKVLTCGCGNPLQGRQVYRKVGDTVIYDARERRGRGAGR